VGASAQKSIIKEYENYCNNGEEITAQVDNEYLEKTYGSRLKIKTYEFQINYNYKGTNYSKKITQNLKPNETEVKITVLKSDGNEFVSGNACKQVEIQKEDIKSPILEYVGIFMTIIGVIVFLVSIKKLFKKS
jgi:hypothetical protein